MVVTIDVKSLNLSRASVFSGNSIGGGKRPTGNGGGILEDMDEACNLGYKERLYGFIICLLAGAVIAALSYVCVSLQLIRQFVVLYSLGNIVALCSTMFLMGPLNQLRRMFHPVRLVATLVYLTFIALTIYFGVYSKLSWRIIPTILCGAIQFLALIWYALSYIPYARTLICKFFGF